MKPVVMTSLEDASGDRCVDLRRLPDGSFDWVECRRDPEDSHGWRPLGAPVAGFADEHAARAAATDATGWLRPAE